MKKLIEALFVVVLIAGLAVASFCVCDRVYGQEVHPKIVQWKYAVEHLDFEEVWNLYTEEEQLGAYGVRTKKQFLAGHVAQTMNNCRQVGLQFGGVPVTFSVHVDLTVKLGDSEDWGAYYYAVWTADEPSPDGNLRRRTNRTPITIHVVGGARINIDWETWAHKRWTEIVPSQEGI